ncbi:hypothetical protein ACFX2J_014379 [Malus domestica]
MATNSGSLNYWRDYFRTANSDIFDIIDHAIVVAASDCPKELRLRRDRIAERLFSSRLTRWCSGCEKQVELATVPGGDGEGDDDEGGSDDVHRGCKSGFDGGGGEVEGGGSKESKVNSSSRDDEGGLSSDSYGLAEALTDEIEQESQTLGEVFRIRDMFLDYEQESDTVLFDSLRKLQLMALNVETLEATEIGKAVSGLKKHGSKQIRHLARELVSGWKGMVDEWVNATAAIASTKTMSDSVNPSFDDEEGLPSPPLDEAFLANQTTTIELSQFFDGMDDDGNPRNNGEFTEYCENGRKREVEKENTIKQNQQYSNEANVLPKGNKNEQVKKREVVKPNKPSNTHYGPGRPPKVIMDQKLNSETKIEQKTDKVAIQKRQHAGQQNKFKCSDEVAVQVKLEATKRKLQERYQQAENAKRQRTVQVMELHDLPKQGLARRNPHGRPGNQNRHWAHGRR